MAGCFASCTFSKTFCCASKEHGLQTGLPKEHLKIMPIIYDRRTPVVQHLRLYTTSGQSDLSFWEALWQYVLLWVEVAVTHCLAAERAAT
jgi:hypothetical protein